MKIYYAHPINIYNSEQEKRDIETLVKLGFEVINPNGENLDKEYNKNKDFEVFFKAIDDCQALAFRSTYRGDITSGVAREVERAKINEIPIIELPSNMRKRELSLDETRDFLKETGVR